MKTKPQDFKLHIKETDNRTKCGRVWGIEMEVVKPDVVSHISRYFKNTVWCLVCKRVYNSEQTSPDKLIP